MRMDVPKLDPTHDLPAPLSASCDLIVVEILF